MAQRKRQTCVAGVVFATALTGLLFSPAQAQTQDWVIVASNPDAAAGVDRFSLSRQANLASASVLMGTFAVEEFSDGSAVRYYISRELFDCERRTRTEKTVALFDASGVRVGRTRGLERHRPVQPGSLYDELLLAVCGEAAAPTGPGWDDPLMAVERERERRVAASLPVTR
ncbi:MAG: hypothetical protein EON96_13530 [Caulobacteraceae bacterium]|nr:MAG: hypothetical protein EON96_13530 [Caulobacteraceae bacterium]